MNEHKDGKILKSNVIALINCHIRAYITDSEKPEAVHALYKLIDAIEDMPVQEAHWLKDEDGAWKCSHCGYRFWNGVGSWFNHCEHCGYVMV